MAGWIDTHAHLWEGELVRQGWNPPAPLDRTYDPDAWRRKIGRHGVDGFVFVEAGDSPAELDRLAAWVDAEPAILAFIAPVDVSGSGVGEALGRWRTHPKFRGLRAHFQDVEQADLRQPAVASALQQVAAADALFEFLVVAEQLPEVARLCDATPDLRVVIEHMGKPHLEAGPTAAWTDSMTTLARDSRAVVKVSVSPRPDVFAAVAAAGPTGFPTDIVRAHFDVLLERFGPGRLVWGSDWPVSLLTADTAAWMAGWHALLDPIAPALDATARHVYRLPST